MVLLFRNGDDGESGWSDPNIHHYFRRPVTAPINIIASSITSNSLILSYLSTTYPEVNYTITSSVQGISVNTDKTMVSLTGLLPGKSYTFNVTAKSLRNKTIATSLSSITYTTLPVAPTITNVSITGQTTATVTFTSANNTDTTYSITTTPSSSTYTGNSPVNITGLTAGTSYTFTVNAITSSGNATVTSSSYTTQSSLPTIVSSSAVTVSGVAPTFTNTGTYTTSTVNGYNIVTFTGNGTFKSNSDINAKVLLVGGGGAGGNGCDSGMGMSSGGGGGGGVLAGTLNFVSNSIYTITVGSGGTPASLDTTWTNPNRTLAGGNGGNTILTGTGINETAIGGGGGGAAWRQMNNGNGAIGNAGGSSGGGSARSSTGRATFNANSPTLTAYGNAGGAGTLISGTGGNYGGSGGGGGGAGSVGGNGPTDKGGGTGSSRVSSGKGGDGYLWSITNQYYGAGAGAGAAAGLSSYGNESYGPGLAGLGGVSGGDNYPNNAPKGVNGKGGGGGGGGTIMYGGNGGSGTCIIAYNNSINGFSVTYSTGSSTYTITYKQNGLISTLYTNNQSTGSYYFAWDTTVSRTDYSNSLNFFKNAGSPMKTANATSINNNFTILGFSSNTPTYCAASFTGYFKATSTGNWTFTLGTSNASNNDISVLWIGDPGQTLAALQTNATETNYSFAVNSTMTYATSSYTKSMISGYYYPIIFNWGQSTSSITLGLGITPPGGSITYDGSNYFFN